MNIPDPVGLILLVLHIASAATAFGVGLTVPGSLRRAAARGPEAMASAAAEANRTGRLAGIFGLATLLSGLALVFYRGGFKAVSPTIHTAILTVILMMVLGHFVQRPAGLRLAAAAEARDMAAWDAGRKRWAMVDGISALLWVVTLALMFIKRGA